MSPRTRTAAEVGKSTPRADGGSVANRNGPRRQRRRPRPRRRTARPRLLVLTAAIYAVVVCPLAAPPFFARAFSTAPTSSPPRPSPPLPAPILPTRVSGVDESGGTGFDFVLTYPSSRDDYRAVGSLLVEAFDEPARRRSRRQRREISSDGNDRANRSGGEGGGDDNDDAEAEMTPPPADDDDDVSWKYFLRPVLERTVTSRYESLARKMRGTKYALVVVKRWRDGDEGGWGGRGREVVGMAELGMSPIPTPWREGGESDPGLVVGDAAESVGAGGGSGGRDAPVPTLGLIAVSPAARGVGVGRALVDVCERIAASAAWGGSSRMCAAVEPDNAAALRLFESAGYGSAPVDADEAERVGGGVHRGINDDDGFVSVQVREGLRTVAKPHVLLLKELQHGDGGADDVEALDG